MDGDVAGIAPRIVGEVIDNAALGFHGVSVMPDFREQYEKAQRLGRRAFAERPYSGPPAAPAQAETNTSQIWGHINAGYLIAYEYTRWWKESLALRQAAVIGDWSWLNKTHVRGADAA